MLCYLFLICPKITIFQELFHSPSQSFINPFLLTLSASLTHPHPRYLLLFLPERPVWHKETQKVSIIAPHPRPPCPRHKAVSPEIQFRRTSPGDIYRKPVLNYSYPYLEAPEISPLIFGPFPNIMGLYYDVRFSFSIFLLVPFPDHAKHFVEFWFLGNRVLLEKSV